MTSTMPAYRIEGWNQAPRIVEVPVPRPGPAQVLVKVAGNGLCHSDLAMARIPAELGRALGWEVPFTLGHEVAGWVDDLGKGVAGVTVGTAVALVSPASCGACGACLRGQDHVCPHGRAGRGYGRDGGLADYVLAGTRDLISLGALDPVTAGPLTDAGATSYHAVKRVLPKLVPGSTAVVMGVGLAAVRPAGAFALVGAGGGTFAKPWFGGLPRDADVFTFQGSSIVDAHEVVALAGAGRIRTDADIFTFDRVAEAYQALAAGTLRGRAVVTPGC